jgi:hypothetical protein
MATSKDYPVHRRVVYTPHRPLIWTLDFNINPAASLLIQTVPRKPLRGELPGTRVLQPLSFSDVSGKDHDMQVSVLDEIYLRNSTTYQVCDEFFARTRPLRDFGSKITVYIYGDPSGDARKSSATRTDWEIIRDFFASHKDVYDVGFRVRSKAPPVKDRVNSVNWLCCDARGYRRLLVHQNCVELIRDLEQVSWKKNNAGVFSAEIDGDADPMRTHPSDALGYFVEAEFGFYPKIGERSQPLIR